MRSHKPHKKKSPLDHTLFAEKTFEFPVFHWKLSVIIGKTAKIAYESFTDDKLPKDEYLAFFKVRGRKENDVMAFSNDPSLNTIAHEVSHAVDYVVTHLNASDEDELRAYHMGYLVEHVYNFVQENKDKFK